MLLHDKNYCKLSGVNYSSSVSFPFQIKKVLLCDRKRLTVRGVACPGGGVLPCPVQWVPYTIWGSTPCPVLREEVPSSCSRVPLPQDTGGPYQGYPPPGYRKTVSGVTPPPPRIQEDCIWGVSAPWTDIHL